ncbi:MAG: helix-turn-helix transcriptional regulator [Alphaproteobacteria bacterium]|nr:helix-turn-helix transcriptional regulator [Alphaproteobacteria bacterium]
MEFKDKVIFARAKLRITQDRLAKELGVSFATVNRWENGNTKPNKIAIVNFNEFCKNNNIVIEEIRYEY